MEKEFPTSGKPQRKKLETKSCCFFCLTVTEFKAEADGNHPTSSTSNKVTVNLKSLQRYLQLHTKTDYGGRKIGDIEADLCEFCGRIINNFSNLFSSLERIQIEIQYWLERIQQQISEASKRPELVQTYSKRMTSDAKALAQLVFVDNLRKEISTKIKTGSRKEGRQNLKVHLLRLQNSEVEKYSRKEIRKREVNVLTTHQIQSHTEEEPQFEDDSLPVDDDYQQDFEIEVSNFKLGDDNIKEDPVNPPTESSQLVSNTGNNLNCKPYVRGTRLKRRHRCDKCGSLYLSKEALKGHIPKCGDANKGPPQTNPSTYSYFDSKTKKFNCKICKKAFAHRKGAANHYLAVHLQIEYKCEDCKLVLSSRNTIDRHRQTCQGRIKSRLEKGEPDPRLRHTCTTCGMGFAQKSNMERHQKVVHIKLKEFGCNHCQKKFSSVYNLKDHERRIHFGVLFSCKFCKKCFESKNTLGSHQNNCAKCVKLEPEMNLVLH